MFMANESAMAAVTRIESLILTIRGQKAMLDSDLARIYGVSTMRLNEQVKRNRDRFPADFAFQFTRQEFGILISQIAISKTGRGGRRTLPWVFTEHGAIMLASVLNSPVAIEASVRVVRAFVFMREQLPKASRLSVADVARKLAELEGRVGQHDEDIKLIFTAIRELIEPEDATSKRPRRRIGFSVDEQRRIQLPESRRMR
jgi:hypothetical protein